MKIKMVASNMLWVTEIFGIVHEAQAASPADTAKASLNSYFKAWNEPEAEKRKALLKTAWTEKGT